VATTIDAAKAKLRVKIPSMPGRYNSSMSTFFGRDVSSSGPCKAYGVKVTPGMEDRWEKNLRQAFGA